MTARHPRAGIAATAVEGFTLGDDLTDEDVRAYVSRLWGQDWDCPEDADYDALVASRDQEDEDFDAAMRRRVRDRAGDDLEDRVTSDYDSRADTLIHSQRVGELLVQVVTELLQRSTCHDRSKTEPPELEIFNEFTPKLKHTTYGSDEYKGYLAAMGEGLAHHYAHNPHHPEAHAKGVAGMTLVDVVEMLADWKAATERHADGDMARSLDIQRERFGLSDQLVAILRNTAEHFGWLTKETA